MLKQISAWVKSLWSGSFESDKRVKKKKLALMAMLALLFLLSLTCSVQYVLTRQPISSVLGVIPINRGIAPRYLFSMYGVDLPIGIALSPDEKTIYVAESSGERRVVAFDRDGNMVNSFVPANTTPGDRLPIYVAVDKSGKVYVADRIRRVVDIYRPDGKFVSSLVPDVLRSGGWQPLGLYIDNKDNLYVTEVSTGFHRVMRLDSSRQLKDSFGTQGRALGELNFPNGLVVDGKGRIVVSNGNNNRMDVFDLKGGLLGAFGAGSGVGTVGIPRSIALDNLGRLYVVDVASHLVNVYDDNDEKFRFMFSFGEQGMGDGQLSSPTGVAVDSVGRVYISDTNNRRVQVWVY